MRLLSTRGVVSNLIGRCGSAKHGGNGRERGFLWCSDVGGSQICEPNSLIESDPPILVLLESPAHNTLATKSVCGCGLKPKASLEGCVNLGTAGWVGPCTTESTHRASA